MKKFYREGEEGEKGEEEIITTNSTNPHERKKMSRHGFVFFVWFVVKNSFLLFFL
jgi:hypothetical protein